MLLCNFTGLLRIEYPQSVCSMPEHEPWIRFQLNPGAPECPKYLIIRQVGTQYFAWSPVCLLYPILSSSSGDMTVAFFRTLVLDVRMVEVFC